MTVLLSNPLDTDSCNKTAFMEILFFVWYTLIAQTILTARYEIEMSWSSSDPLCSRGVYRMYALTMKNVIVTGVFVCITIPQLALGIYQVVLITKAPGTTPSSVRRSLMLLVLNCWKSSRTTPSYPPPGLPSVHLHQKSEGGSCLHDHLALLWFTLFPRYSISTHSST